MKPCIMVHPNKPWEAPWMLREFDSVEEAKVEAWKMAQRRNQRDPNDPERYHVYGFVY